MDVKLSDDQQKPEEETTLESIKTQEWDCFVKSEDSTSSVGPMWHRHMIVDIIEYKAT